MRWLSSATITLSLLAGIVPWTRAAQSTSFETRTDPKSGLTITCAYPSATPLVKGPITLIITKGGRPVTDAKVSFTLTTPRGESKELTPEGTGSTPYSTTADLEAPGVYRLVARIRREGTDLQETFLWSADQFDAPRISPAELRGLWKRKQAVLVDVRNHPDTYVQGALVIPRSELDARLSELPKDKLIATYCTCNSEHAAALATQELIARGYRSAAIYGSLDALKADGWRIETRK